MVGIPPIYGDDWGIVDYGFNHIINNFGGSLSDLWFPFGISHRCCSTRLCPGALIESLKEQSRLAAGGTMEGERERERGVNMGYLHSVCPNRSHQIHEKSMIFHEIPRWIHDLTLKLQGVFGARSRLNWEIAPGPFGSSSMIHFMWPGMFPLCQQLSLTVLGDLGWDPKSKSWLK